MWHVTTAMNAEQCALKLSTSPDVRSSYTAHWLPMAKTMQLMPSLNVTEIL